MSAEQLHMEALLNDYANKTAMHFNAFGYAAVTPDEVKKVFSWQRETQVTFGYLKEWCEENMTTKVYNGLFKYGHVTDDRPTALVEASKMVDRMNWDVYYPYKTGGCPYCNCACKPNMRTCGSDECMTTYRKEYVLMSLNI